MLSSDISCEENNDVFHKAYSLTGFSFTTTYDDGNIIADENNCYSYDANGQLISTQGAVQLFRGFKFFNKKGIFI